jgi:vitamin B12 transporter
MRFAMTLRRLVATLFASLLATWTSLEAQMTPSLSDSIEVIATRLPQPVERRIVVLTREEIARLPVRSVADLVAWIAGAGVARRAAFGIQADAGLRGATFEQMAVLVNGVRVNDPQTGHFHLDVPYPLEAVKQVVVLLGPGSAVHGPDAFGGVVEITVDVPAAATARLAVGEHGLHDASAVLPLGGGAWLATSRTTSTGFRPDTEFAIARGLAGWCGSVAGFDWHVDLVADDKDFGAWAFYSQRFPNQREHTGTAVTTIAARRNLGWALLDLRAGGRQHRDVFILDRQRPEWYRNRHRSRGGSLQATITGQRDATSWSVGAELQREALSSSRLGQHRRERAALFAEGAWQRDGWGLALQARADHVGGLGWEVAPAVSVSRALGASATLAYHGARSFRLPSFTELYYVSPDTVGNPGLSAESAWSDELLLRIEPGPLRAEMALFRRRADHLIDYLRDDEGIFHAINHAASSTVGGEVAVSVSELGPFSVVRLAASRLESDLRADPLRSRYGLSHPRFEVTTTATVQLPLTTTLDLAWRYRAPQRRGGFALADLRLSRPVGSAIQLALEAINVLDRAFEEVPGVPMPRRWVSLSAVWTAGGAEGGEPVGRAAEGGEPLPLQPVR